MHLLSSDILSVVQLWRQMVSRISRGPQPMGVHHQEQAPAPLPWIPCLCMRDRPSRWVAWVCVCALARLSCGDKELTRSPFSLLKTLAMARRQSVLVCLCLCSMIYVRVSCGNEALTCAELMEALWFSHHSVTRLSHLSFSPRRFNPASHTRLAAARCSARTSGSWQEVLFRSSPLPLLTAHFFMLAFFTPRCYCRCYVLHNRKIIIFQWRLNFSERFTRMYKIELLSENMWFLARNQVKYFTPL